MHSTLSSRICTMTRCDLACLQHGGPVQRHGGPAVQRHGGLHQPGGSAAPRCRRGSAAAPRRAPWSSSDWVLASPNELRPSAPCSSPSLSPVYVGSGRAWLLGLSGSSAGSAGSQSSLNPSANSTSSGPVPRSAGAMRTRSRAAMAFWKRSRTMSSVMMAPAGRGFFLVPPLARFVTF
jgi:hypothetical protein